MNNVLLNRVVRVFPLHFMLFPSLYGISAISPSFFSCKSNWNSGCRFPISVFSKLSGVLQWAAGGKVGSIEGGGGKSWHWEVLQGWLLFPSVQVNLLLFGAYLFCFKLGIGFSSVLVSTSLKSRLRCWLVLQIIWKKKSILKALFIHLRKCSSVFTHFCHQKDFWGIVSSRTKIYISLGPHLEIILDQRVLIMCLDKSQNFEEGKIQIFK